MTTYWLGVAAKQHVAAGVQGGYAQLGHGKHAAVASLQPGDWLIYYAPRETLDGGDAVQAFVAAGRVMSNAPYQVDAGGGFRPHRVDVAYEAGQQAAVRPLLSKLNLTCDLGSHWGAAFRTSKRRLTERDAQLIAEAMGVDLGG